MLLNAYILLLARILTAMYIIRFLIIELKVYRKQSPFKLSTSRSFINCPKIRKVSTFLYAYLPVYYYFRFFSKVTMQQQISYSQIVAIFYFIEIWSLVLGDSRKLFYRSPYLEMHEHFQHLNLMHEIW